MKQIEQQYCLSIVILGHCNNMFWNKNISIFSDLETFQQMVAAAGAMAMSNPLLLNPLILSQVINAQQLNQNDPKFHFSQVNKC